MSGEKKQKPEELLAKIRKIEDNKYCVNCGEYAKLGVPYSDWIYPSAGGCRTNARTYRLMP